MDSDEELAERPHRSRGGHTSSDRHNGEGSERRERLKGRSRSNIERERDSAESKQSTSAHRVKCSTSPEKRKKHTQGGAQTSASPERQRRKHHRGQRGAAKGIEHLNQETPITAVLRDLRDDIQEDKDMELYDHHVHHDGAGDIDPYHNMKAGGCVYIEHQSGFTSVPRNLAFVSPRASSMPSQSSGGCLPGGSQVTALEVAIGIHKIWMPVADLCLGLLAGIALMQAIVVGQLLGTTPESAQSFVSIYGRFSYIFTILYYLLIALCLIGILDRLDLAHCDWTYFYEMWPLRPHLSWLLVPSYLGGVICTLTAARSDDWIYLSQTRMSSQNTSFRISEEEFRDVHTWYILNTLRCVFVVVGWFLMALTQPSDQFLHYLTDLLSYKAANPLTASVNLQTC